MEVRPPCHVNFGRPSLSQATNVSSPVISWGRLHSPYYNESHRAFRAAIRSWIEVNIMPHCVQADEEGTYPSLELNKKLAEASEPEAEAMPLISHAGGRLASSPCWGSGRREAKSGPESWG